MLFIVSILIPLIVGSLGGLITAESINTWYLTLNKPAFTPPGYLFAPVWTVLYLLMGVSFYLTLKKRNEINVRPAVTIYVLQLVLNFLWSALFFGLRNPLLGLGDILLLLVSIVSMIIVFYKIDKSAAFLQIPYAAWVSFATLLNLSIVLLN